MREIGPMTSAASANIASLFETLKRSIEETRQGARARPIAKARPRYACGTCQDMHFIHFVQDSGTGGYDMEPGGNIPCPDCSSDEWADAVERASFR
jgi:hypothetical protein